MWCGLECDLASKLPPSRQVRRCRQAKVSVRNIVVDVEQVGPIEQIEELKPNFKGNPLGDACVLIDVDIGLGKVRLAELAHFFGAFLTERRNGEVAERDRAGF